MKRLMIVVVFVGLILSGCASTTGRRATSTGSGSSRATSRRTTPSGTSSGRGCRTRPTSGRPGASRRSSSRARRTPGRRWRERGALVRWACASPAAATITINGFLAIALMRLSAIVNDRLILTKFDDKKEIIEDRNAGTSFVYVGSFLATGLMINGVLTGESASLLLMVRDILIYWLVGQAILILGGQVLQRISHYDVQAAIEKDNVAAGVVFGFFLAALGGVTRMDLAGASSEIWTELVRVIVFAGLGIVLLCAGRFAADRVMLPASPLDHEVGDEANTGDLAHRLGGGCVATAARNRP